EVAVVDDELQQALAQRAPEVVSGWLPFGVGGDELALLGLDLSGAPTAVVAGPAKSGRTTTLLFVLSVARASGVPVRAVCGVRNALAEELGHDALVIDGSMDEEQVEAWVDALPRGGLLLVDDADLLRSGAVDDAMDEVVSKARGQGWRIVL